MVSRIMRCLWQGAYKLEVRRELAAARGDNLSEAALCIALALLHVLGA